MLIAALMNAGCKRVRHSRPEAPHPVDRIQFVAAADQHMFRFEPGGPGEPERYVCGNVRLELTDSRVRLDTTPLATNIIAAIRMRDSYRFLTADGLIVASTDFLGPLRRLQTVPSNLTPIDARGAFFFRSADALMVTEGDQPPRPISNAPRGIRSAAFLDALRGSVVLEDGTVCSTHDGGASWSAPERLAPSAEATGVALVDDTLEVTTSDGAFRRSPEPGSDAFAPYDHAIYTEPDPFTHMRTRLPPMHLDSYGNLVLGATARDTQRRNRADFVYRYVEALELGALRFHYPYVDWPRDGGVEHWDLRSGTRTVEPVAGRGLCITIESATTTVLRCSDALRETSGTAHHFRYFVGPAGGPLTQIPSLDVTFEDHRPAPRFEVDPEADLAVAFERRCGQPAEVPPARAGCIVDLRNPSAAPRPIVFSAEPAQGIIVRNRHLVFIARIPLSDRTETQIVHVNLANGRESVVDVTGRAEPDTTPALAPDGTIFARMPHAEPNVPRWTRIDPNGQASSFSAPQDQWELFVADRAHLYATVGTGRQLCFSPDAGEHWTCRDLAVYLGAASAANDRSAFATCTAGGCLIDWGSGVRALVTGNSSRRDLPIGPEVIR